MSYSKRLYQENEPIDINDKLAQENAELLAYEELDIHESKLHNMESGDYTEKVKSIYDKGTWESQYGTKYKFQVSFDNGIVAEINKDKSGVENIGFKVGDTLEFNYQDGQYPKITVKKENNWKGGGGFKQDPETQVMISRQSAVKAALEHANIQVSVGNLPVGTTGEEPMIVNLHIEDILAVAKRIHQWQMTGEIK